MDNRESLADPGPGGRAMSPVPVEEVTDKVIHTKVLSRLAGANRKSSRVTVSIEVVALSVGMNVHLPIITTGTITRTVDFTEKMEDALCNYDRFLWYLGCLIMVVETIQKGS